MHGVEQSFTSLYNPCRNTFCERFNHMLFGLLKTLMAEQKADWPAHLPASLCIQCHSTCVHWLSAIPTYVRMPSACLCDNWLGLHEYNDVKSVTRIDWVDQQLEQLINANKHAQKNIKDFNSKNWKVVGSKDLLIPVGNLVLLHDHPEGHNKIQNNKDQIYIVTSHHKHKNVYFVKPLGSKIQPKQLNRCGMFDLGITEEQEIEQSKTRGRGEQEEQENKDEDLPNKDDVTCDVILK